MHNAISQVLATLVESKLIILNDDIVENKILSVSGGLIENLVILEMAQKNAEGIYTIKIAGDVRHDKVSTSVTEYSQSTTGIDMTAKLLTIQQEKIKQENEKILREAKPEISTKTQVQKNLQGDSETEQIVSIDKLDTQILLQYTNNRGYWVEGDRFHLITCIYLNTPMPPVKGNLEEEFEDIQISHTWAQVLESHRDLWLGGVSIITNPEDEQRYLLALVSTKSQQSPLHLDLILHTKACREVAHYIQGIAFKSQSIMKQEMTHTSFKGEEDVQIVEKFQRMSSQEISASVQALHSLGTLRHKASQRP